MPSVFDEAVVSVTEELFWLDLLVVSDLPDVLDVPLLTPALKPTFAATMKLIPPLTLPPKCFPFDRVLLCVMEIPFEIPSDIPSVLAFDSESVSLSFRVTTLRAKVESWV